MTFGFVEKTPEERAPARREDGFGMKLKPQLDSENAIDIEREGIALHRKAPRQNALKDVAFADVV
jgi:hypothetical protein